MEEEEEEEESWGGGGGGGRFIQNRRRRVLSSCVWPVFWHNTFPRGFIDKQWMKVSAAWVGKHKLLRSAAAVFSGRVEKEGDTGRELY